MYPSYFVNELSAYEQILYFFIASRSIIIYLKKIQTLKYATDY